MWPSTCVVTHARLCVTRRGPSVGPKEGGRDAEGNEK